MNCTTKVTVNECIVEEEYLGHRWTARVVLEKEIILVDSDCGETKKRKLVFLCVVSFHG